jgi:hypothetical protein
MVNGNHGVHPWLLLAPWYRWPVVAGDPRHGRGTAPALQKYASPGFMAEFLEEPQRSLRFVAEDEVHRVEARLPKPKYRLSALVRVPTGRRKLFRDVHSRFYLVVVELCCDQPGLPAVRRDEVFAAGFVVRRRAAPAPGGVRKVLADALGEVQTLEARLAHAQGYRPPRRRRPGAPAAPAVIASALSERCEEEITRLEGELATKRTELRELAAAHGVRLEVQGWLAGEHAGIGAWQAVEETPVAKLAEQTFPLYPLVPDPADGEHSARGRTLYFGVVPTGPGDLDELGNPRFDDHSLYEVRCFVRRKKAGRPDCPGDYVWSQPSEPYQLAPAADLDGTSHKPVTFTLPDLKELEAQAAVGEGIGVRMVAPPDSSLQFQTDSDGNPTNTGIGALPQICSFSIPLITIIATFVLKLFLPIVVFAFGLWFLLKLKFCILPSFEMDAGLAAELSVQPPSVDISAALTLQVDAALQVNLGADGLSGLQGDLDANQRAGLALEMAADYRAQAPPELAAEFPPQDPQYPAPRVPLRPATAGLEYHERVEWPS